MPKISFRAVDAAAVRAASGPIVDEMQALLGCPREALTVEVSQSTFMRDGSECAGMAVVEVEWLPRPKELQDRAAELIARHLKDMGHDSADIIFTILDPERFYRIRP